MKRFSKNFSLKQFVKIYVAKALKIAEENPLASEFYERLYKSVSKETGVSEEAVKYLHHPFHWAFFDNNKDSPFEYVQTGNHGTHIRLQRNYVEEDVAELSNFVLKDYKNLLEQRVKSPEQKEKEREEYYKNYINGLIPQS